MSHEAAPWTLLYTVRLLTEPLGPMPSIQKTKIIALSVGLAAMSLATTASAQFRVGAHVGTSLDAPLWGTEALVGIDAWIGVANLTDKLQLHAAPAINYIMGHAPLVAARIDAVFLYELTGTIHPYGLLGGTYHVFDETYEADGGGSAELYVSPGMDFGAGALFMADKPLQFFVEGRAVAFGDHGAELDLGVLFTF